MHLVIPTFQIASQWPSQANTVAEFDKKFEAFASLCHEKGPYEHKQGSDFIENLLNDADQANALYPIQQGNEKRFLLDQVIKDLLRTSITINNIKVIGKQAKDSVSTLSNKDKIINLYNRCAVALGEDLEMVEKIMKLCTQGNVAKVSGLFSILLSLEKNNFKIWACGSNYKVRIDKKDDKINIALTTICTLKMSRGNETFKSNGKQIIGTQFLDLKRPELRSKVFKTSTAYVRLSPIEDTIKTNLLGKTSDVWNNLQVKILNTKDPRKLFRGLLQCKDINSFNELSLIIKNVPNFWSDFFSNHPHFLHHYGNADVAVLRVLKKQCSKLQWISEGLWLPTQESNQQSPLANAIKCKNLPVIEFLCSENPLNDKTQIYKAAQNEFRSLLNSDPNFFDKLLDFFPENLAYEENEHFLLSELDNTKKITKYLSTVSLVALKNHGEVVVEKIKKSGQRSIKIMSLLSCETSQNPIDVAITTLATFLSKSSPGRIYITKTSEIKKDHSTTWLRAASSIKKMMAAYKAEADFPFLHPIAFNRIGSASFFSHSQKVVKISDNFVQTLLLEDPRIIVAIYLLYKHNGDLYQLCKEIGSDNYYREFSPFLRHINYEKSWFLDNFCSKKSVFSLAEEESYLSKSIINYLQKKNSYLLTQGGNVRLADLKSIFDAIMIVDQNPDNCYTHGQAKLPLANINPKVHWSQRFLTSQINTL